MKLALLILLLVASPAFAGPDEWMIGGTALRIDTTTETPRLLDATGKVLHSFGASERIKDHATSKAGTCLLLRVMVQRATKSGSKMSAFDYGYLLRLVSDSSGRIRVSRVLERSSPPMSLLHRWISELGAVADDGTTALLKFGEADREEASYTMTYSWQKWDLSAPKVLSTGLQLDDAKKH